MEFYFGLLQDEKELKQLTKFLLFYPMNYPNYEDWVTGTCIPELAMHYKETILAYVRENKQEQWQLIGNAIFQPAKESQLPLTLHFKNMRVAKNFRREGIASFLVKQVEKAALKQGLKSIILDLREEKTDVFGLLLWQGYRILYKAPLYDNHNQDIVMIKSITKPKERGFLYRA